jgi:hypothetical protein
VAEIIAPAVTWRKSSFSESGNCVEVAFTEAAVLVRDSKDTRGPVLSFPSADWAAFLTAVVAGEHDLRR